MTLLLIKAKYVILIFIVKKAIKLKLFLIEINLLDKNVQYAKIKVTNSIKIKQIKVDIIR